MRYGIFLLSGYNQRSVIACCRWAAQRKVPVHVAARGPADPIYLTSYADAVFLQRATQNLEIDDLCDWIQALKQQHGYEHVLIAPSTEYFNRFLLGGLDRIRSAGGIVPLAQRPIYETVSDKFAFGELCRAHGIDVPQELPTAPATFPYVAKPRTYASARLAQIKPYLIYSSEQHQRFMELESAEDFYFQEFVHGRSIYLLSHIAKSGIATSYAQENLIQQAHGGSVVLARAHDFHTSPLAGQYLDMLRSIGFHGLVMVEVRLCERTGRYFMIEANPRMWGPLQFVVDNQIDLIGALVSDHGFDVPAIHENPMHQPYYFWSGGLARNQQPFAYHNYSAQAFVDDYQQLVSADVFRRSDTLRLFDQELSV
jgi:predicted ATP-grasp superfamily ATP-dependent carboligase